MAPPVLEVDHLTKSFDGVTAINDISFSVDQGEIIGFFGPNGAGKTTLIQLLLGLITATSGTIRILGMNLEKDREKILSQVNFSSTYVSMPTSLTLLENMKVFAKLYGIRQPAARIEFLFKLFEIDRLKGTLTRHLSSGQLTRLSLAKALLNSPKILFLDEPTASLDPDIADKTRTILKSIRDENAMTVLYTSHNMKEMQEISDRIILLNGGKIIVSGHPSDILQHYEESNLEALFLRVARGDTR